MCGLQPGMSHICSSYLPCFVVTLVGSRVASQSKKSVSSQLPGSISRLSNAVMSLNTHLFSRIQAPQAAALSSYPWGRVFDVSCPFLIKMKAIIRITAPFSKRSSRLFSSSQISQADRERIRQFYTRGYQEKAKRAYELKQEILNEETALSTQISPAQRKKCEMLVEKVFSLSPLHLQHFYLTLSKKSDKPLLAQHIDWNNIPRRKDGTFEQVVPGYFSQQELISQVEPTVDLAEILGLDKLREEQGTGGGEAEEVKEEKKEEAREKDNYDIQLLGYDEKLKIKLIKEIRAMKKLGLKEAKEEIEGLPKWIYRGVKADDAKEIAAKLKELGAEINMI